MGIKFLFSNENDVWALTAPLTPSLYQYDNNSRTLSVEGDLPEGWTWSMLCSVRGRYKQIFPLVLDESGASFVLSDSSLAFGDVNYEFQLRGEQAETTRRTNSVSVYVPKSLTGQAEWKIDPAEFTEMEAILNGIRLQTQEASIAAKDAASDSAQKAAEAASSAELAGDYAEDAERAKNIAEEAAKRADKVVEGISLRDAEIIELLAQIRQKLADMDIDGAIDLLDSFLLDKGVLS